MGQIHIGMNLEATRHHDKPFEWGLDRAADMGYEYVEPMVHFGRELMSEAGYYHTYSLFNDPMAMKEMVAQRGLKISGLQAHGPLGRPDYHGEYLKLAIRFAAECGAPVVNTDEGIKAPWTTEEEDFVLMKYTLREALFVAERRGVLIGLECHAQYSKTPAGLDRIYDLVASPSIGINLDTGNAYLAGTRPLHLAGTRGGSPGAPARQGYQRRAFGFGTRQSDRHTRGLRLRRRRDRLATCHRHLPPGAPRYRVLGRVRHDRSGQSQPRPPEVIAVIRATVLDGQQAVSRESARSADVLVR